MGYTEDTPFLCVSLAIILFILFPEIPSAVALEGISIFSENFLFSVEVEKGSLWG